MRENLDFSVWLIEQSKDKGFHYLGDGLFRYDYRSPYTIEEMYKIFLATFPAKIEPFNNCYCGREERVNGEHYCKKCLTENPFLIA